MPPASSVRLKVGGARASSSQSFDNLEVVLSTRKNPELREVWYSSLSGTTTRFYLQNDDGIIRSAMQMNGEQTIPGHGGTATSCAHYRYSGNEREIFNFTTPGPDGSFCSADDESLSGYIYSDQRDGVRYEGESAALGPDGLGRTADDVSPSFRKTERGENWLRVCRSSNVGADKIFLTDDDNYACTCLTEDRSVVGIVRRIEVRTGDCETAPTGQYVDEAFPEEDDEGDVVVRRTLHFAAIPGQPPRPAMKSPAATVNTTTPGDSSSRMTSQIAREWRPPADA